jgi:hypothetical protein
MPEAQRLVPSAKVEQKKPARQSASPEQVPHSSVEAQEDMAPIRRAAQRAIRRFAVIGIKGERRKWQEATGIMKDSDRPC